MEVSELDISPSSIPRATALGKRRKKLPKNTKEYIQEYRDAQGLLKLSQPAVIKKKAPKTNLPTTIGRGEVYGRRRGVDGRRAGLAERRAAWAHAAGERRAADRHETAVRPALTRAAADVRAARVLGARDALGIARSGVCLECSICVLGHL